MDDRVKAGLAAITLAAWSAPVAVHAQGAARVESSTIAVSIGAGARAFGMGGAFIAVADDATAASWNPSGLAVLERPEGSFVAKGINRVGYDVSPYRVERRGPGFREVEGSDGGAFAQSGRGIEFASLTYPFRVRSIKIVPQLSFQRTIDLGYTTRTTRPRFTTSSQEFTSPGFVLDREFGDEQFRLQSDGGIDTWAASVGVGITPTVYVGAAVNLWRNGAPGNSAYGSAVRYRSGASASTLCQGSPCGDYRYTIDSVFSDRFHGTNVNLGLLFKPGTRWRAGLVYKAAFDMSVRSTETLIITADSPLTSGQRTRASIESTVRWPRTLGAGLACLLAERVTLSADVTTTQWSKGRATSTITEEDLVGGGGPRTTTAVEQWPGTYDPRQPVGPTNRTQVDALQLRLGGEYLMVGKVIVPFRAGAFMDRQFTRAPGGDRVRYWGATAGTGIILKNVAIDAAYVYQWTSVPSDFVADDGVRFEQRVADRADRNRVSKLYVSAIFKFGRSH